MNFNIYNSIILAGVIQGLIFGAVVLFTKKYKHKSIFFLTAIIVFYSLSNLQFYFADIKAISYNQLFAYYFIPFGNTIPVLLYFYVVTYLNPSRIITKKEKFLILPFIISFAISLLYKTGIAFQFNEDLLYALRYYMESYDELICALFHIVVIIVLLKKIKAHSTSEKTFNPKHIQLHLNWLKLTLIAMVFVVALWIVITVLYMTYSRDISYYPFWLAMAGLIYWLGHIGIYKYGIVEQRKQIRKKQLLKKSTIEKGKTKHIIIERLKQYLENEKCFLDASLSLEKTAEALELSQGHLSKIINTELGVSFKDFVNTLRVEEAKLYLTDADFSNYTLVAIGLEAGFNSKSAFNTSFKKITGQTPSQFKKQQIN